MMVGAGETRDTERNRAGGRAKRAQKAAPTREASREIGGIAGRRGARGLVAAGRNGLLLGIETIVHVGLSFYDDACMGCGAFLQRSDSLAESLIRDREFGQSSADSA